MNLADGLIEKKMYERESRGKVVCTRLMPRSAGSNVQMEIFRRYVYIEADDLDGGGSEGWALISETRKLITDRERFVHAHECPEFD